MRCSYPTALSLADIWQLTADSSLRSPLRVLTIICHAAAIIGRVLRFQQVPQAMLAGTALPDWRRVWQLLHLLNGSVGSLPHVHYLVVLGVCKGHQGGWLASYEGLESWRVLCLSIHLKHTSTPTGHDSPSMQVRDAIMCQQNKLIRVWYTLLSLPKCS